MKVEDTSWAGLLKCSVQVQPVELCLNHGSIRTTYNDREMTSLQKMVMNYPDILSIGKREDKAHAVR